jgi:hypothetical protein
VVRKETELATTTGCWFSARNMLCRTLGGRIDGLVIASSSITDSKILVGTLRDAQRGKDASA